MTAVTTSHAWIVGSDITAQDTWTDELAVGTHEIQTVSLNVTGTFSGTVTVQMWRDDQTSSDAKDVHTTTTTDEFKLIDIIGPARVRAGIKTGEYTSGTAEVELAVV
jgi:hypothetical protein